MRPIAIAVVVLIGCAAATDYDAYLPAADSGAGVPDDDDDEAMADSGSTKPDAATPALPAVVQTGTGHIDGTTKIPATIVKTKAGNLLVVTIANENASAGSVKAVTDDVGNAYVSANAKSIDSACADSNEIWFAKNVKEGATVVTVEMTVPLEAEIWVIEASGLSKDSPLDGAKGTNGVKATSVTAPTVAPTSAHALIVSTASSCDEITGVQPPFTNLPIQIGEGTAWFISQPSDGPGPFGAVWTSGLDTWNASTAAFKP